MFDRSHTIVGSGQYICEQLLFGPKEDVTITRPYLKPAAPVEIEDFATGPEAARFAAHYRAAPKVYPVSQPQLHQYAQKLIEVSRLN